MAIRDIRPEDVLGAIELLDDPVQGPQLLSSLHYGPATDYRLVHRGRFYPT